MSNIPALLKQSAELEKTAQYEYIRDYTASTMAHLMKAGVPHEKAAFFAREACMNNKDLVGIIKRASLLEKTAEYMAELETKIETLGVAIEKKAEDSKVELPEHLQKLSNLGFSQEEIDAIQEMPNELVEKVASAVTEPWSMGKAAGVALAEEDPLLKFIMS